MAGHAGGKYFKQVLGLFLAAAFLPALILSFTLGTIASGALTRADSERGREAAQSFAAGFRALAESVDKSLGVIAAAPEVESALGVASVRSRNSSHPAPDESTAAIGRLLALEASRQGGVSFALIEKNDGLALGTRSLPADWDAAVYGGWGIFREASNSAGTVFEARRRLTDRGETALIVAGRAIRDPDGAILGFALAEIDRSALIRTARAVGLGLTADFELIAPSRMVAFSLIDSGREGLFEDELFQTASTSRLAKNAKNQASETMSGTYIAESAGGFTAKALLPQSLLEDLKRAMNRASLMGLILSAFLAIVLALAASRIVTKPVYAVSEAMQKLGSGDFSVRLAPRSNDELGDLMRSLNATAEELEKLMASTVEDQELLRGAELRALAARMHPHFLYNSLNSIRSLAKLGRNSEIVEIVTRLGKILRASAQDRGELSTVGEGFEYVRHYIAIEKIRFGDRFSFSEDIDPSLLDCELPALVLEPLAENALTHGLEEKSGSGRLSIECRGLGADMLIAFEDDGPGVSPERLAALRGLLAKGELSVPAAVQAAAGPAGAACDEAVPGGGTDAGVNMTNERGGTGLGLAATNRRLRLYYGSAYGLSVATGPDGTGFRVEVHAPQRRKQA